MPPLAVYYAFEWTSLRRVIRAFASVALALQGRGVHTLDVGPDLLLLVSGGVVFSVTPACTYLDLFLVSAPFTWRFERRIARNVASLVGLAAAVLGVNLLRITVAIVLENEGLPWQVIHHGADVAIHTVWITSFVLIAARADAAG